MASITDYQNIFKSGLGTMDSGVDNVQVILVTTPGQTAVGLSGQFVLTKPTGGWNSADAGLTSGFAGTGVGNGTRDTLVIWAIDKTDVLDVLKGYADNNNSTAFNTAFDQAKTNNYISCFGVHSHKGKLWNVLRDGQP